MNTACAGECMFENFKLEYQVVELEYVKNKYLRIEAVCYNPRNTLDKEATLKYSSNNLKSTDEKFKIAIGMVDRLITNLDLSKEKLFKLVVRNGEVFYLVAA